MLYGIPNRKRQLSDRAKRCSFANQPALENTASVASDSPNEKAAAVDAAASRNLVRQATV